MILAVYKKVNYSNIKKQNPKKINNNSWLYVRKFTDNRCLSKEEAIAFWVEKTDFSLLTIKMI